MKNNNKAATEENKEIAWGLLFFRVYYLQIISLYFLS